MRGEAQAHDLATVGLVEGLPGAVHLGLHVGARGGPPLEDEGARLRAALPIRDRHLEGATAKGRHRGQGEDGRGDGRVVERARAVGEPAIGQGVPIRVHDRGGELRRRAGRQDGRRALHDADLRPGVEAHRHIHAPRGPILLHVHVEADGSARPLGVRHLQADALRPLGGGRRPIGVLVVGSAEGASGRRPGVAQRIPVGVIRRGRQVDAPPGAHRVGRQQDGGDLRRLVVEGRRDVHLLQHQERAHRAARADGQRRRAALEEHHSRLVVREGIDDAVASPRGCCPPCPATRCPPA